MKRGSGSLGVLLLLASLAGCNICQSPFDYCGPVIGPHGFPNREFGARAGSAFAPMSDSPQSDTSAVSPTPASPPGPTQDSLSTSPEAETAETESSETATR
jgi:hypothetical protein